MYSPGRFGDVIIQVVRAARLGRRDPSSAEDRLSHYDALVYSLLDLSVSRPETSRYAESLRNLPLKGVERITLTPDDYTGYLASFIEGDKGMTLMRDRMCESMSPGLRELLMSEPQRMRIWWHNVQPELEDYPWELTVEAERRSHQVAFLRGLPPVSPLPRIPIAGSPRIALIGAQHLWPQWAHVLHSQIPNGLAIGKPLREGLYEAVHAGYEVVHAFTDGYSTSALEGILYDHAAGEGERDLPAGELSRILSGSRVVLLSLSPADFSDPDVHVIAGREVLSVFRAFAYIGTSTVPVPTVLAPLGPIPDPELHRFWSTFYNALASSWSLVESLRLAQSEFHFSLPIALFSRHTAGKVFDDGDSAGPPEHEARTALRADLLQSEKLTRDLSIIRDRYTNIELPASVRSLLEKEQARQTRLRSTLDPWIDEEVS